MSAGTIDTVQSSHPAPVSRDPLSPKLSKTTRKKLESVNENESDLSDVRNMME